MDEGDRDLKARLIMDDTAEDLEDGGEAGLSHVSTSIDPTPKLNAQVCFVSSLLN